MPDSKTGKFHGTRNLERLSRISHKKQDEEIERSLELGLEAAPSVIDRTSRRARSRADVRVIP